MTRARGADADMARKTMEEKIRQAKAKSHCAACGQKGPLAQGQRVPQAEEGQQEHQADGGEPAEHDPRDERDLRAGDGPERRAHGHHGHRLLKVNHGGAVAAT